MKTAIALALLISAVPALAAPPPITAAEKAACEIVADHLDRGPGAIVELLAKDSPLALLGQADARAEIDARVGPSVGAWWELRTTTSEFAAHGAVFHVVFPSGLDDVVIFEMVQNDDRWLVQGLRTLAEMPPRKALTQVSTIAARDPGSLPSVSMLPHVPLTFWVAILLAPILALVGAVLRTDSPRVSLTILLTALVSFGASAAFVIGPQWLRSKGRSGPAASRSGVPFLELRQLAPLRHALATGVEKPVSSHGTELRDVATLWRAGALLGRVPSERTLSDIEGAKTLARSPLALLLGARVAARGTDSRSAFRNYRAIREIEPDHDTFWLEEAQVAPDEETARRNAPRHSRDSHIYYEKFVDWLKLQDETAARRALQEAWRVRPLPRSSAVSGAFGMLLRDPATAILVNVNTPDDQKTADFDLGSRPMRVPTRTLSVATGMLVRLSIGLSRIDIPGGAAIAPINTTVVSARDFQRGEQTAALRAVEGESSPSLASAASQRTINAAAEALAEHNNWQRIVELTRAVRPDTDNISIELVIWRVQALIRTNHIDEARQLATGPAVKHATQREPDAGALLQIADLLASTGAWLEAIEVVRKASSVPNAPDVSGYLRRLELRRVLAASPPVLTTKHFEIHTSVGVPVTVPERVGELLEAELLRLLPRFKLAEFHPVRVNVIGWEEFSNDLTGSSHVVGFYDGEISIPFGEVANFRGSVVSILTHELTHAIVAQASGDNAPHWFQEGIASRMELVEKQDNIFRIHPTKQFVALELLDPTLLGSIDPKAISEAYLIAQTFVRYLEDRHGPDSINRFIEAFRAGSSTEESIMAVTKQSISAIDHDFRAWGTTHGEPFIDKTPWPYARFYSLGIDPKVRDAIRFSRPKAQVPHP